MAKLTLSAITSGYLPITTVNANWDAIETALENTLSRDGTAPNAMAADLDMDSNNILNLPTPGGPAEPATKAYVDAIALSGTGYAYVTIVGPTVARTYTLPDANATLLYSGGPLGTPSSGVATNLTGTAASLTAGNATNAANATLATTATSCPGADSWTGNKTLGENVALVLDPSLSADGKYCGIVEVGTSAAAISFGEVVYRVTATGKWDKAKADVAATSSLELGMCVVAAAGADVAVTVLLYGKVRADVLFDTFTVAAPVYISAATAGKTVSAAPTGTTDFVVRKIGFAEDANTVFFKPSNDYITLT